MPLTPEQKHANRVERTYERFRALQISKVKNDVLRTFQKLRRLECAEWCGMELVLTCISSGNTDRFEQFDAGHFISRKHTAVAFSRDNVWPQLKYENDHLNGNLVEYRRGLVQKIGEPRVLLLETWKDTEVTFTKWQYAQMKEAYRVMVRREEERLEL